jgi:hypothetical protein
VRYRGRGISQDIANSLVEFYAIAEGMEHDRPTGNGVLELGAGYGRLAWVYLSAFPDLRYFIVDIPPALAICQDYLTRLFPDRPAFRFRRFDSYSDVADEMRTAQIGFLTPNQLELVPDWGAGAFINVSSFTRCGRIESSLRNPDRSTPTGRSVQKQWRNWSKPRRWRDAYRTTIPSYPAGQNDSPCSPDTDGLLRGAYEVNQ